MLAIRCRGDAVVTTNWEELTGDESSPMELEAVDIKLPMLETALPRTGEHIKEQGLHLMAVPRTGEQSMVNGYT